MATNNKDFKIKNGLIVEGATASVNGNNVITEASSIGDLSDVDLSGASNGEVLTYSSGNWIPSAVSGGGGGGVTISDTAPGSPSSGDIWYDSANGKYYLYYNDVDSSQWIEIASYGGVGANLPQKFTITGERSSATPTVGQNYALGNGSAITEAPMSFAGQVTRVSVFLGSSATGTLTVELVKNGTGQGSSYYASRTGAGASVTTFGTPLSFDAGDSLNVSVQSTSGTIDASAVQIAGTFS